MPRVATRRSEETLPLSTAILLNIALSLFMWNITLRAASVLLGSVTAGSL
jgi:hypothetical protein